MEINMVDCFSELPKDIQDGIEKLIDSQTKVDIVSCVATILKVYKKLVFYNELNLIQYGYSSTKGRYYDIDNFHRQKKIKEQEFKVLKSFIIISCEDNAFRHDCKLRIPHPKQYLNELVRCPFSKDILEIVTGKKRLIKGVLNVRGDSRDINILLSFNNQKYHGGKDKD